MPVLDAAAMINAGFAEGVTVPEVIAELKDFASRELAEARIASGQLRVQAPSAKSLAAVKSAASPKLSKADIAVLALAFELKEQIITDDYALQSSARRLGIAFVPVIAKGIKP